MTSPVDRIAAVLREHRMERWSVSSSGEFEWWGHCVGCEHEGPRRTTNQDWEEHLANDQAVHAAEKVAQTLQQWKLDGQFISAVTRFMEAMGYDQSPVFTAEMARDAAEFGRQWANRRVEVQE